MYLNMINNWLNEQIRPDRDMENDTQHRYISVTKLHRLVHLLCSTFSFTIKIHNVK